MWDPAHPERPAKVFFEDPKSIIFDLQLSYDAQTVFFSMRRDGQQYWQIYEMGIDGQNFKQITDGDFFNVCPVPLPDGRLALPVESDARFPHGLPVGTVDARPRHESRRQRAARPELPTR